MAKGKKYVPITPTHLQSTTRGINLRRRNINRPNLHRNPPSQSIHRLQRNIKPIRRRINRRNINTRTLPSRRRLHLPG